MLSKISKKWAIAGEIRRDSGLLALLKHGLRFLIRPFYEYHFYYLFEKPLAIVDIESKLAKNKSKLNTDDLNFKIVSSNREADQLEKEGYEFRSHSTNFNLNHSRYTLLLNYGLTAFCTFKGKEFVAISWIIASQKAQDNVKPPPISINYDYENYVRGVWCHPKYRGIGIHSYTCNSRDLYLAQKGINMLRGASVREKQKIQTIAEAMGSRKYGEARYLKIFCWKFWKESHFNRNHPTPGLQQEATG